MLLNIDPLLEFVERSERQASQYAHFLRTAIAGLV